MKTTTIFILVFLVLASFAYAAPPVRTPVSNDYGIVISYPQLSYYHNHSETQNQINFRWWTYNSTSGQILTNTTSNCTFDLMNYDGTNIIRRGGGEGPMGVNFGNLGADACQNCWNINISKRNFTYHGGYYYQIRCFGVADKNIGGFVTQYFAYVDEKTYNSLFDIESKDNTSGISITLFLMAIVLGLLYIGLSDMRFMKMDWSNLVIKRGAVVISIWLMVYNFALLASLSESANLSIVKDMFAYMYWFGWAGYVAMVYLVIKTLFDAMELWKMKKERKRSGDDEE